jgi:hypothetical protein
MIALKKRIEKLEGRSGAQWRPFQVFVVGGCTKTTESAVVHKFLRSCGHDIGPNSIIIHLVGMGDDEKLVDRTSTCRSGKPEQSENTHPEL